MKKSQSGVDPFGFSLQQLPEETIPKWVLLFLPFPFQLANKQNNLPNVYHQKLKTIKGKQAKITYKTKTPHSGKKNRTN
jgi:hypothetical protein